jgi:hypothetical protein
VQVHVLELNNEAHTEDDMYLWQFSLPDPRRSLGERVTNDRLLPV